jgi:hypothetical protein
MASTACAAITLAAFGLAQTRCMTRSSSPRRVLDLKKGNNGIRRGSFFPFIKIKKKGA